MSYAGQFQPRPVRRYAEVFDSGGEAVAFGFLHYALARPRRLHDPWRGPGALQRRIDFELPGCCTYDGYSPVADHKPSLVQAHPRDFDDLARVARFNNRILLLISIYERVVWRTTREGGLLPVPHWFHQRADGLIQLRSLRTGVPWDDLWWEATPGILERAYAQARADARSSAPQPRIPGLTA